MAALGTASLRTIIYDTIADEGYVSAPMLQPKCGKSLQWINRVLTDLESDHKLKYLGKLGTAKYYVGPRSLKTLQDIERIMLTRVTKATAWMGQDFSPTTFITMLEPERQKTAQKLFDPDAPGYIDFFNQVLPALELVCFGKRANTQATIDAAWAIIGQYEERVSIFATFLRLFVNNEHVRSGNFADQLSDFTVNNYRSAYTRESA